MATSGMTVIGIPKMPSPVPTHRKSLISMDNQAMELPNSMVPEVAKAIFCCFDKDVALGKEGGKGNVCLQRTCHIFPATDTSLSAAETS